MAVFFGITFVSAVSHNNWWYGAAASVLYFLIFMLGFYMRETVTADIFENVLNFICLFGVVISFAASVEKLIHLEDERYRSLLWFGNSNYLAAVLSAVVVICAYKVIALRHHTAKYYAVSIICAFGLYSTGSLFVWVEILMAVSVILTLTKRHTLLAVFLILCTVACMTLYFVPDLFPRMSSESNVTTDNRVIIWSESITHVLDSPLFGQGFYTHNILENVGYVTPHSHNIIIEQFLSFGIVGTALLSVYAFIYFRAVIINEKLLRHNHIPALILAISGGLLLHGMIDLTMLWAQTTLLYVIIFSGLGACEKIIHRKKKETKQITTVA